jgi:beta-phosphoglucomutase-like phosphatase (HAD superfamily)
MKLLILKRIELLEGVGNQGTPQKGMQPILASSALKLLLSEFWHFSYTIFSHIVSGEEDLSSKPDPAILNMLSLLLLSKENCIGIEDTQQKAASCRNILRGL